MRISDWSSEVCSSDLAMKNWHGPSGLLQGRSWIWRNFALKDFSRTRTGRSGSCRQQAGAPISWSVRLAGSPIDRKSDVEGKSVSVRVDLGGRLIIKKKKKDKSTR